MSTQNIVHYCGHRILTILHPALTAKKVKTWAMDSVNLAIHCPSFVID